jgi:hypothetical protein
MVKQRKTKNRRRSRRNRRTSRKMRGGFAQLNGSNLSNTSMDSASNLSLAQGTNYGSIHKDQHGGQNMGSMALPPMNSSNMGSSNMGSMNTGYTNTGSMNMGSSNMGSMNTGYTNTGYTNTGSMNTGMPPKLQMGGVAPVGDQGLLDDSLRTSAHLGPLDRSLAEIAGMSDQAGGRRRRRRGRKSRKSRGRKSRGRKSRRNCSMRGGVANVTDSSTLLTGDALKGAVEGMNPEWKLVEDASAFNPRM